MHYTEVIKPLNGLKKEEKIIVKENGHDQALALQLYDSGNYKAQLLCSKIFRSKDLTKPLMEKWAKNVSLPTRPKYAYNLKTILILLLVV